MPTFLVLSTLTDHGLTTRTENPDNAATTRVSVELCSRGSGRLMTLPADDAREFVKSLK